MSTVPKGTPPRNANANVPQQIPTGNQPVPSKPAAVTGRGPSISIPKVGKAGK